MFILKGCLCCTTYILFWFLSKFWSRLRAICNMIDVIVYIRYPLRCFEPTSEHLCASLSCGTCMHTHTHSWCQTLRLAAVSWVAQFARLGVPSRRGISGWFASLLPPFPAAVCSSMSSISCAYSGLGICQKRSQTRGVVVGWKEKVVSVFRVVRWIVCATASILKIAHFNLSCQIEWVSL